MGANMAENGTVWPSRGCPRPHLLHLIGLPMPSLLTTPHRAANTLSACCTSGLMGLLTPSQASPSTPQPLWGCQRHHLLRLIGLPMLSLPAAPHGAIDSLTSLTLRASS